MGTITMGRRRVSRNILYSTVLLLAASQICRAETINVDFNTNDADVVHVGSNGVYSQGGTFWNSVVPTNTAVGRLVTEGGRTTSIDYVRSGTPPGGFRSQFTNTLQDTGFTRSSPPVYLGFTNLDATLQWDLAVYFSTNGQGVTIQSEFFWASATNYVAPTGQLPGTEGADYLLFTNMPLTYALRGKGTLVIVPAVGARLAGVQLRPSPVQVPPVPTRYVAPGGGHVSPYTNWATAATSLQAAVAAAAELPFDYHEVILVSNGVYAGEGSNGVVCYLNTDYEDVTFTLRSVNGPESTIIDGSGCRSCLYVTDHSVVDGFTLRNGRVEDYAGAGAFGGGAYIESGELSHCIVVSNSVLGYTSWMPYMPGGNAAGAGVYVADGTIRNCLIVNNSATGGGGFPGSMNPMPPYDYYPPTSAGSAYGGGLYLSSGEALNCTIAFNRADPGFSGMFGSAAGSGLYGETAVNTIVYGNTPASSEISDSVATYSCSPLLTSGTGNITNDPSFRSGSGYRLNAESLCRDAGENDFWTECGTDIDDAPRQLNGRVDMGASEFWGVSASTRKSGDAVELGWYVVSGRTYIVQSCTSLLANAWNDAAAATNPTSAMLIFKDQEPSGMAAYRLLMETDN